MLMVQINNSLIRHLLFTFEKFDKGRYSDPKSIPYTVLLSHSFFERTMCKVSFYWNIIILWRSQTRINSKMDHQMITTCKKPV